MQTGEHRKFKAAAQLTERKIKSNKEQSVNNTRSTYQNTNKNKNKNKNTNTNTTSPDQPAKPTWFIFQLPSL